MRQTAATASPGLGERSSPVSSRVGTSPGTAAPALALASAARRPAVVTPGTRVVGLGRAVAQASLGRSGRALARLRPLTQRGGVGQAASFTRAAATPTLSGCTEPFSEPKAPHSAARAVPATVGEAGPLAREASLRVEDCHRTTRS